MSNNLLSSTDPVGIPGNGHVWATKVRGVDAIAFVRGAQTTRGGVEMLRALQRIDGETEPFEALAFAREHGVLDLRHIARTDGRADGRVPVTPATVDAFDEYRRAFAVLSLRWGLDNDGVEGWSTLWLRPTDFPPAGRYALPRPARLAAEHIGTTTTRPPIGAVPVAAYRAAAHIVRDVLYLARFVRGEGKGPQVSEVAQRLGLQPYTGTINAELSEYVRHLVGRAGVTPKVEFVPTDHPAPFAVAGAWPQIVAAMLAGFGHRRLPTRTATAAERSRAYAERKRAERQPEKRTCRCGGVFPTIDRRYKLCDGCRSVMADHGG